MFIRRKHGTEIIAAETIYIQTTKAQQVEFIYLYKLLYTNIRNSNSQRKRDHQFERWGTEDTGGRGLGRR